MSELFLNGVPGVVTLGTNDQSRRELVYQSPPDAIHTPFHHLLAEWGPTDPVYVYGDVREVVFGRETFKPLSKYFNHQTAYANVSARNACPCVIKRIKPEDAGEPANFRLSVDVLTVTDGDHYERELDGSFKVVSENPVVSGQGTTHTLRFVVEHIEADEHTKVSKIGLGTVKTGDQSKSGTTSKRYPLFDFTTPYFGSKGNTYGVVMYAPLKRGLFPMNDKIYDNDKAYPYRFAIVERDKNRMNARIINNNFGEAYTDFVLKPDMIDSNGVERYMGEAILDLYEDKDLPDGVPDVKGPFSFVHVYQDNIDTVLNAILESEKAQDYTQNELRNAAEEDKYKVNLFGGVHPSGVPYQTVRWADLTTNSVRLSENTRIFAQGGSDGTISKEAYEAAVRLDMENFADPNHHYQDDIGMPATFLWDSGFSMETKRAMSKFISVRKNTIVVLSTHVDGERNLTLSEELAREASLTQQMQAYLDSRFYGTSAFRFAVIPRHMKPFDLPGIKRISTSYDFIDKVSALCNSRAFLPSKLFDKVPGNIIRLGKDVSHAWVPDTIRAQEFRSGVMAPAKLEQNKYYFPSSSTGYNDSTSILKSFITAIIISRCQTLGIRSQRMVSGSMRRGEDNLSDSALKQAIEDYLTEELRNAFADLAVIKIDVYMDKADHARGTSYHVDIHVATPNQTNTQILSVVAHRLDDLGQQNDIIVA